MYENAGLADALCFVNQWDHCTIPIHALEVALKLRQLDTVAFFLKNQDKGKLYYLNLKRYIPVLEMWRQRSLDQSLSCLL